MASAASLAISFFLTNTVLPIVNEAPALDQLGLAATLVFGRLATVISVIPTALDWFMGLFGRLVFTLALPAPSPALLLAAFSAFYNPFGPGAHIWLTLESGPEYHDISSSFPRFMPTRIYASAPPFSTMSSDWVRSSRGRGHPLYNSPSAEPTGFNEVAVWLDPGMTRLEEILTGAFYPLAAVLVLAIMSILLSAMADRFNVSIGGCIKGVWNAFLAIPSDLLTASLSLLGENRDTVPSENRIHVFKLAQDFGHNKAVALGQEDVFWTSEYPFRLHLSLPSSSGTVDLYISTSFGLHPVNRDLILAFNLRDRLPASSAWVTHRHLPLIAAERTTVLDIIRLLSNLETVVRDVEQVALTPAVRTDILIEDDDSSQITPHESSTPTSSPNSNSWVYDIDQDAFNASLRIDGVEPSEGMQEDSPMLGSFFSICRALNAAGEGSPSLPDLSQDQPIPNHHNTIDSVASPPSSPPSASPPSSQASTVPEPAPPQPDRRSFAELPTPTCYLFSEVQDHYLWLPGSVIRVHRSTHRRVPFDPTKFDGPPPFLPE